MAVPPPETRFFKGARTGCARSDPARRAGVKFVTEPSAKRHVLEGSELRMRSIALTVMLVAGACGACANAATPAHEPAAPSPIELVVAAEPTPADAPAPPKLATEPVMTGMNRVDPAPLDEKAELPKTWTGPIVPGLGFAVALRRARGARDAHGRLVVPTGAAAAQEASMKTWFIQAQSAADQASRMYAAAFHAPDATREGRVEAIAEAAELDMTMARSLDEAGLGLLPTTWRSDPAVASTFEDIAVGPTRRWRDEARVLARQCVETARETAVATEAARRCVALRTGAPVKQPKHVAGVDAGAPCACAAGDPLCSASLGGWCGP